MFPALLRVVTLSLIIYNAASSLTAIEEDLIEKIFATENTTKSELKENVDTSDSTKVNKDDKSCLIENQKIGVCVVYYLCDKNDTLITNGLNNIDARYSRKAQRRRRQVSSQASEECKSFLDKCCLPPSAKAESEFPPKDQNDGDKTPAPVKPKSTTCGFRNTDGITTTKNELVEGQALFGEFNWMAAILRREIESGQELNVYQCGGSLIHPQVVLTAAGCVLPYQRTNLIVRAGEWDTSTRSEELPHQDRDVVKVIAHPQYADDVLFNDAALLFLNSPVNIAKNVGTICLPGYNENIAPGTKCFATGWGKDIFGKDGRYQRILKKVELPIVSHGSCQQKLRSTSLGSYFSLDKSFICAGGEKGKDTCKGDGGSPLVCPIQDTKDRYVQVGTVSWGKGCGEADVPGVYGNVALFRQWIDEVMTMEGYNIDSYA